MKSDGTAWACGNNSYGQFGNGTTTSSKVPVKVGGLSSVVQISAGEWHSFFVMKDGSVCSSGRNQYGQLGDGTTIDRSIASRVPALSDIVQAEAGGIHSVFVRSDGTVWSCGLTLPFVPFLFWRKQGLWKKNPDRVKTVVHVIPAMIA